MANDNNTNNNGSSSQTSSQTTSGSTVSDIISTNPQPKMRPISEGFTLHDDSSSNQGNLNDGE